jgi:hypothetical protein
MPPPSKLTGSIRLSFPLPSSLLFFPFVLTHLAPAPGIRCEVFLQGLRGWGRVHGHWGEKVDFDSGSKGKGEAGGGEEGSFGKRASPCLPDEAGVQGASTRRDGRWESRRIISERRTYQRPWQEGCGVDGRSRVSLVHGGKDATESQRWTELSFLWSVADGRWRVGMNMRFP